MNQEARDALSCALTHSGRPDRAALLEFRRILAAALHNGEDWAYEVQDLAVDQWTQRSLIVDYHGNQVTMSVVAGRRVRTGADIAHQQELFSAFTWQELLVWRDSRQAQIDGENVNIAMAEHLIALRSKWPSTSTVGEALRLEGKTLEQYLGEM